jgi:UDP-N-acetylmuramoyl-tripeptide--D-alanyl-D-alanine ligase
MIPLSGAEVADLADGHAVGDAADVRVTGPVVVDSRAAVPGGLFVAVKGAHVDGHDFGGPAAAAGAVLALGAREVAGLPTVVVADPVHALGQLAHGVLARLPLAHVVGLTGSVGKTTTKDLLAALLSRLGPTVAPPGSYNNELGLPLTVLAADAATRHLVLEMGARGVGHIRELCVLAPPRTGLVLNVGSAHLGEFGSREAVAAAKGELVEALPADGVAVLSADDAVVAAMAARTDARVVTFGESEAADVRAVDVSLDAGRARFGIVAGGEQQPVALRLVGRHQVANATAAAAAALEAGLPLLDVAAALSAAEPVSRWRMEVVERPDGVTVVNDAYNANPESVRAALDALVALAGDRPTWAVLGEMRELGPGAADAHAEVGRYAAALGVGRVVAVGEEAAAIAEGAGAAGRRTRAEVVADVDAAVDALRDVRAGDVVLVKASRAAGLERVVAVLLGEAAA